MPGALVGLPSASSFPMRILPPEKSLMPPSSDPTASTSRPLTRLGANATAVGDASNAGSSSRAMAALCSSTAHTRTRLSRPAVANVCAPRGAHAALRSAFACALTRVASVHPDSPQTPEAPPVSEAAGTDAGTYRHTCLSLLAAKSMSCAAVLALANCRATTVSVAPGRFPRGFQSSSGSQNHTEAAPADCALHADATSVPAGCDATQERSLPWP